MPHQPEQLAATSDHPPAAIRWRSWPLRDDVKRTSLAVGGLMAAVGGIWLLTGRILLALAALAALVLSLWRFFLPVAFELNDKGVDQRFLGRLRHISWHAIGRYEVCSAGVLVLPNRDRSVMAPFRGLYLPFGSHREEILACFRRYLGRPEDIS